MTNFTREELEAKTVPELRYMCVYELLIPGMTKKPKDTIISAILENQGSSKEEAVAPITGIEFAAQSTITKPDEKFGFKTTTTVHVSCGASAAQFDVAGRTVKEIADFLREALNVDRMSTGLVNGKEVDGDYIVKPGDHLEFLKPAGQKGC